MLINTIGEEGSGKSPQHNEWRGEDTAKYTMVKEQNKEGGCFTYGRENGRG